MLVCSVPSYGTGVGASTATIEHGVAVLGVQHVIVCGHTDCGVMRAILQNVRIQLDHLRTHPAVAARLRRGALQLHGWVYSISTGEMWTYDLAGDKFVPL